jgi:hypothetical protein
MVPDGGVACIEIGDTVTFVVAADCENRHLGGVVIDVLDKYVVAVPGDIIQESGLGFRWPAFAVGKRGMTMTFIQVRKADVDILKVCQLSQKPPVSLILKACQLSQTEPVKLVPEALLHAATPPRYRYFHVDVLKKKSDATLGLVLKFNRTTKDVFGVSVVQVKEGSSMSDWNARCARTFPEDQLRSDDQIVQVNEVIDIREFEKVMKRDVRMFMIVRRRLT